MVITGYGVCAIASGALSLIAFAVTVGDIVTSKGSSLGRAAVGLAMTAALLTIAGGLIVLDVRAAMAGRVPYSPEGIAQPPTKEPTP